MNKRLKEGEYMKVRVHELAKKHDIKNKEFLEILKKDIGINVTSHLSNLDEDQVKKIDDYFAKMNMLKVEMPEPAKAHKEKKEERCGLLLRILMKCRNHLFWTRMRLFTDWANSRLAR